MHKPRRTGIKSEAVLHKADRKCVHTRFKTVTDLALHIQLTRRSSQKKILWTCRQFAYLHFVYYQSSKSSASSDDRLLLIMYRLWAPHSGLRADRVLEKREARRLTALGTRQQSNPWRVGMHGTLTAFKAKCPWLHTTTSCELGRRSL